MASAHTVTLLDRYREVVETMRARYSERSHSFVVAMMEWLHAMHEQALARPDEAAELQAAMTSVVADIRGCYERATLPAEPLPRDVVAGDPPLYVFDRACYTERYGQRRFAVTDIASEVPSHAFDVVEPGRTYLYVVDDLLRFLVCRAPVTVEDLLRQRNPRVGDIEVFHPMLVPDRLTVAAAGEITFFGTTAVHSVVANLKSGHFRPSSATIDWLSAHLRVHFPEVRLLTLIPVEVGAARAVGDVGAEAGAGAS